MAASLAFRQGTVAATLFHKFFVPVRAAAATTPSLQRFFNSSSSSYRNDDFVYDVYGQSSKRRLEQILEDMAEHTCSPVRDGSRPEWDAKEVKDTLILRYDMPGLDRENVKISVDENTLAIRAEKGHEEDEVSRKYSSQVDLPNTVYKLNEIKAEMKKGVLKIRVPLVKFEESEHVRHIDVE
ncbi:alpha crystallin/HSP20 domain-containing protein [Tanacetum coccineum]